MRSGYMLGSDYSIVSLDALGISQELPENQDTLEGNSLEKALYVYNRGSIDCFADDTGLEVTALNGAPGVLSARYAGNDKDAMANTALLLRNMLRKTDRSAQFRTVITLVSAGRHYQFEGIVKGTILDTPRGNKGFGYDPVFQPTGYTQSFAEMSLDMKNTISHRSRALDKLVSHLKNHIND